MVLENDVANLPDLVGLSRPTSAGLQVEYFLYTIAAENVMTATTLALIEAQAPQQGTEFFEADRLVGHPA